MAVANAITASGIELLHRVRALIGAAQDLTPDNEIGGKRWHLLSSAAESLDHAFEELEDDST